MEDMRVIERSFGLNSTYSYMDEYEDFETYKVLPSETITQVVYSVIVVALILLLTTVSLQTTALVLISVILVALYMLAVTQVWGVEFNHMSSVTLSFALGVSLDYSSHIAHAYLVTKAPDSCLDSAQKRDYKAKKALSSMGSSVIHGGFSTFVAVIVLSQAQLYGCIVAFKCWSCIVFFGLLNGLVLLPVMLSLTGPLSFGSQTEEPEKIYQQPGCDKAQQSSELTSIELGTSDQKPKSSSATDK